MKKRKKSFEDLLDHLKDLNDEQNKVIQELEEDLLDTYKNNSYQEDNE